MNETELFEFEQLKRDVADLRYALTKKAGAGSADIKGRIVNPSSVAGALTINAGDISAANMFAAGVVDQTAIGANACGQSELKEEVVTLAFGSADTSKTATVTASSIVIGVYASTVTGNPASSFLQLSISGTTLTGTLSAAPGGATAVTYTVVLLKT